MARPFLLLLSALTLGCAPAPAAEPAGDPAPVEAVRPTGPHAAGVIDGPPLAGGVTSRVYYPAAATGGERRREAFSADHRVALARRFGPGAAEALGAAMTAGRWEAPRAAGRFPLVVFQPGAAMAAADYRLLLEDLASRGYVVLALNPDGSPPASAGRYAQAAAEMIAAAALARAGHSSLGDVDGSVALIGHSLGGAAAVMALNRVAGAVAVNLDGDFGARTRVPPGQPVLYLFGQTPGESDGSRSRRATVWREVSGGGADAVPLQIVSLRHFDFADAALIQSPAPARGSRFGPLGGPRAHAVTTDLVAAFLDSRLKGQEAVWPGALARNPEAAAPSTW